MQKNTQLRVRVLFDAHPGFHAYYMLMLHAYVVPISMYNILLFFLLPVSCDATFEGLCALGDLGIYLKTDLYDLVHLHICDIICKCLYVSVCNRRS